MIVLDASALIAFLDPSDALHSAAVSRLLALESHRLLLSPITHAEILVGPARAGTLAATEAALDTLVSARSLCRPMRRLGSPSCGCSPG